MKTSQTFLKEEMKFNLFVLIFILFSFVSCQHDFLVSDCRVVKNCKKCSKEELDSYNGNIV